MIKNAAKYYINSYAGLSKEVWLMATMMFINRFGTLIMAFLTLYTTKELGWTLKEAGLTAMWFSIGALCGAMLGGYLTDKIGFYKTILIGLIGGGLMFITLPFFRSFEVLCIMLFFSALISDVVRPAVFGSLPLFTDENTRTRAVSLMRLAFNLGFTFGPLIGGILVSKYNYSLLFYMDGVTCIAAAIFLVLFMSSSKMSHGEIPEQDNTTSKVSPYTDIPFLGLLFFSTLMLVSFFQLIVTFPLYLTDLGFEEIHYTICLSLNCILIVLVEMPIIKYLEGKFPYFKMMIWGSILICLATISLLLKSYIIVGLTIYLLLISIGEIVNFPYISSAALKRAPGSAAGKYMSLITIVFSVSLILAPIAGTYVLDAYGFKMVWISMAGLALISALGYKWVWKYWGD